MEERRGAKELEARGRTFEIYTRLKRQPQGSVTDDADLRYLVRNMGQGREIPTTLLGIAEVLRINAPKCVLDREERHRFFSLLVETLPRETMNLESFITYRIPSLLTDRALILKLTDLVGRTTGTVKQYLKEIVVILIEEREEEMVRDITRRVLLHIAKDPTLSSIIEATRDITMPLVELAMEEFDDKVYSDIYSCFSLNGQLCIRNVRGPGKLKYVRAAMSERNFERLCGFYIGDRDKRVVEHLAAHCSPVHTAIFHRILTDPDENVRLALIRKIGFEEGVRFNLDIHERALDTSPMVRGHVLHIFKSGSEMYKRCFGQVCRGDGTSEPPTEECCEGVTEYFLRLMRFVLRGVLTRHRDEYIQVLRECGLQWEHYFQVRSYKGLHEFLMSGPVETGCCNLPESREEREFYLRYVFRGEMCRRDVVALIDEDIHSALEYLKDKDVGEYADHLVARLLTSNVDEALEIIEMVGPYLMERTYGSPPKSDVEFLLYAHSRHTSGYVSDVTNLPVSFPMLYFLAHMKIDIETMLRLLLEYKGSCEEHIEIQLAYNDKRLLQHFVDYFMDTCPKDRSKRRLVESRTFVGTMIYFVSTGQVSIRNTDFFISSMHFICTNATNRYRAKEIYEAYATRVDQETFNRFHTICSRLRHMTLNREHKTSGDRIVIEENDKMLYLLCDTVLSIREGSIVDEAFNLSLFHRIPARILDMIVLGHVV